MSSSIDFTQLAERVIAHSTEQLDEPEALARAIDASLERLAQQASVMVGETGFRALAQRALHLTRTRLKHTAELTSALPAGAPAEPWVAIAGRASMQATRAAAAEHLAVVLGLLCSFIGEDLTVRIARRTWTELDLGAPLPPQGKT